MLNFKDLHSQYTVHKNVIEQLTGSIASDQLMVRLLQSLKKHAESLAKIKEPDEKYNAFIEKLDFTVDQKQLDRIRTQNDLSQKMEAYRKEIIQRNPLYS
jgi:Protein of unknown function (DUF1217).